MARVRFSDEGVGDQFVCGGADFAEADVCGMVPAGVAGQDGVALRGIRCCGLFVAFPFGAGDAQLLDDMLEVVAAGCVDDLLLGLGVVVELHQREGIEQADLPVVECCLSGGRSLHCACGFDDLRRGG